jgi:methylmalonyl-CoA mutase cobalamin-binding subunit
MSSAGRAVSSSGFGTTPKERGIGWSGFAAQIRLSSLTGSYGMATAEHREPCESRGSRTVLGAPGGEIPPGDSTETVAPTRRVRVRYEGPSCRADLLQSRQKLTRC